MPQVCQANHNHAARPSAFKGDLGPHDGWPPGPEPRRAWPPEPDGYRPDPRR